MATIYWDPTAGQAYHATTRKGLTKAESLNNLAEAETQAGDGGTVILVNGTHALAGLLTMFSSLSDGDSITLIGESKAAVLDFQSSHRPTIDNTGSKNGTLNITKISFINISGVFDVSNATGDCPFVSLTSCYFSWSTASTAIAISGLANKYVFKAVGCTFRAPIVVGTGDFYRFKNYGTYGNNQTLRFINCTLDLDFSVTTGISRIFSCAGSWPVYLTNVLAKVNKTGAGTLVTNDQSIVYYDNTYLIESGVTLTGSWIKENWMPADPNNDNLELLPNSPALIEGQVRTIPTDAIWMKATGTATIDGSEGEETNPWGFSEWVTATTAAQSTSSKTVVMKDGTYDFTSSTKFSTNSSDGVTFQAENKHSAVWTWTSRLGTNVLQSIKVKNIYFTYTDIFTFFGSTHFTEITGCRVYTAGTGSLNYQNYNATVKNSEFIKDNANGHTFAWGGTIDNCSVYLPSTATSTDNIAGGVGLTLTMSNTKIYSAAARNLRRDGTLNLGTGVYATSNITNNATSGALLVDELPFADPDAGNFELLPNSPVLVSDNTTKVYVNFSTGSDATLDGTDPSTPYLTVAAAEAAAVSNGYYISFQNYPSGVNITLEGDGITYDFSETSSPFNSSGKILIVNGGCTVKGHKVDMVTTSGLIQITSANDTAEVTLQDWNVNYYSTGSDLRHINTTGTAATSILGVNLIGCNFRLGMGNGALFSNAIYGGTIPCSVIACSFVGRGNTAPGQGNILLYTSSNAPIYFTDCIFDKGGANALSLYGSTYDRAVRCYATDDCAGIPTNFTTIASDAPLFADPANGNFELLPNSPVLA